MLVKSMLVPDVEATAVPLVIKELPSVDADVILLIALLFNHCSLHE
jgi:hypothetical protein